MVRKIPTNMLKSKNSNFVFDYKKKRSKEDIRNAFHTMNEIYDSSTNCKHPFLWIVPEKNLLPYSNFYSKWKLISVGLGILVMIIIFIIYINFVGRKNCIFFLQLLKKLCTLLHIVCTFFFTEIIPFKGLFV